MHLSKWSIKVECTKERAYTTFHAYLERKPIPSFSRARLLGENTFHAELPSFLTEQFQKISHHMEHKFIGHICFSSHKTVRQTNSYHPKKSLRDLFTNISLLDKCTGANYDLDSSRYIAIGFSYFFEKACCEFLKQGGAEFISTSDFPSIYRMRQLGKVDLPCYASMPIDAWISRLGAGITTSCGKYLENIPLVDQVLMEFEYQLNSNWRAASENDMLLGEAIRAKKSF